MAVPTLVWAMLLVVGMAFQQWPKVCGEEPVPAAPPAPEQQQREKLLDRMRRRAEGIQVVVLADQERIAAEAIAEPLLRFSDQPRRLRDGTLWGWCRRGRPVALFKTQVWQREGNEWWWLDSLTSVTGDLIEAEWPDGHRFASRKPGLEWRAVADGPEPSETPGVRLRQMKDIARRFSITITVWPGGEGQQQEMRFLSRPLYRYSAPDDGSIDGALFGFATNGTNPDAVLAIELAGRDGATGAWQYGFAQMTTGGLSAHLDDAEVWTATLKPDVPTAYDEWIWFHVPSEAKED